MYIKNRVNIHWAEDNKNNREGTWNDKITR